MEQYREFLGKVAEVASISDLTPDEDGLVSLKVDGSVGLNLQFIPQTSKIFCFVDMCDIPVDAGGKLLKDLLSANLFYTETAGGSFAIDVGSNRVIYQYMFDFVPETADATEFVAVLEKILSLMDLWIARVNGSSAESEGDAAPSFDVAQIRV